MIDDKDLRLKCLELASRIASDKNCQKTAQRIYDWVNERAPSTEVVPAEDDKQRHELHRLIYKLTRVRAEFSEHGWGTDYVTEDGTRHMAEYRAQRHAIQLLCLALWKAGFGLVTDAQVAALREQVDAVTDSADRPDGPTPQSPAGNSPHSQPGP